MFKKQSFYLFLLILFSGLFLYAAFDYWQYDKNQKNRAFENGKIKKEDVKVRLDAAIDTIENRTKAFAELLSQREYSKSEIEELVKDAAEKSDFCIGITAAFEPEMLDDSKVLYSPFFSKMSNEIEYIEEAYDYTNDSLETAHWYTEVIKKKQGNWSKPYMGQVAKELIIDYGVPFYKIDENGDRSMAGVVSFTIASIYINNYLHQITMGKSGFAIITTKELDLISHPSTQLLTNPEKFRQSVERNPDFQEIIANNEGTLSSYNEIAREEAQYFYSHLKNNWVCDPGSASTRQY